MDPVVDRRAGFDGGHVGLEHFVDQPFLAFEVVVELAFAGSGSLDDVIRAGCSDSLFVKQVGRGLNDSKPGFGSLGGACSHDRLSLLVLIGTIPGTSKRCAPGSMPTQGC